MFTLPVVVLISLLAQPRLFAAMANDGLLPKIFAQQDPRDGNLFYSNLLCGIPMTVLATFVPFSWMDDAISVGILFAFNITNTALILMKCSSSSSTSRSSRYYDALPTGTTTLGKIKGIRSNNETAIREEEIIAIDDVNGIVSSSYPARRRRQRLRWCYCCCDCWFSWSISSLHSHILCYHLMAFIAGVTSHLDTTTSIAYRSIQIGTSIITLAYALILHCMYPITGSFGDITPNPTTTKNDDAVNRVAFEVPCCPLIPLIGIYLNWYLISQLEFTGILLLILFLTIISGLYIFCISGTPDITKSGSGTFDASSTTSGLQLQVHQSEEQYSDEQEHNLNQTDCANEPILLREMSMPKR